MAKTLQSSFLNSARVGTRNLPAPQTWDGGDIEGESTPDRSPGQRFPSAVPGEDTITPVTLTWMYDPTVWTDAIVAELRNQRRVENAVTATQKAKDANGAAFGKGSTYVGTMTAFRLPQNDSNSSDRAVVTLEFQPTSVT